MTTAYVSGTWSALGDFKLARELTETDIARLVSSPDEETAQQYDHPVTMLAKGTAGLAAPGAANNTAAVLLAREPRAPKHLDFSSEEKFRDLAKHMGEDKVKLIRGGYGAGMGYVKGKPAVILPRGTSEAIAGHELGHAKNWNTIERLFGQKGRERLFGARVGTTGLGSVTTMPLSALAATDPDASWTPGAIQAGIYAPTLLDEGLASAHSLRALMQRHGVLKGLRQGSSLAPAFATYGAIGLTPAAITGGRKLWRRYNGQPRDTESND